MKLRNLGFIAIALAIGGIAWFGFARLSQPAAPASGAATNSSSSAPQDTIHEKAALEEELKTKPGHAPILLRLAELERNAGRVDGALNYLRQAADVDPSNEDALLELGRAQFETGDIDGALKTTEKLVQEHPSNVDGLYNLGAIHANLGHNDQAKEYWTKAAQVDPASESGKRATESMAQLDHPVHGAAVAHTATASDPIGILLQSK